MDDLFNTTLIPFSDLFPYKPYYYKGATISFVRRRINTADQSGENESLTN